MSEIKYDQDSLSSLLAGSRDLNRKSKDIRDALNILKDSIRRADVIVQEGKIYGEAELEGPTWIVVIYHRGKIRTMLELRNSEGRSRGENTELGDIPMILVSCLHYILPKLFQSVVDNIEGVHDELMFFIEHAPKK